MYVYGQLTAPNPDNKAMSVTPITPTRLISCSMDRMPEEGNNPRLKTSNGVYDIVLYTLMQFLKEFGHKGREMCIITMFRAQDGKWVSQFPEEIHESKPNHTSKEKPLTMH